MNKELLISIKPEHLVNILYGKKTRELRTRVPKEYKGWVNIYCSKNEILEESFLGYRNLSVSAYYRNGIGRSLSGKVVARFWFDEYDSYRYGEISYPYIEDYYFTNEDLESLCLTYEEVREYGNGKTLYAWHIKKLEIFDKPKELSEFYKTNLPYVGINEIKHALEKNNTDNLRHYSLSKAPQSYQFVYVKENLK